METIDHASHDRFLESFRPFRTGHRYAGIPEQMGLDRPQVLHKLYSRYQRGKLGPADRERSALWVDVLALSGRARRVLSAFLAIGVQGYLGIIAPEEINSETVRRITGEKCGRSTYFAALAELVDAGLIDRRLLPTGTRYWNERRQRWGTCQIDQLTFTPRVRLLWTWRNLKQIPIPSPSMLPTADRPGELGRVDESAAVVVSHTSTPVQKVASTVSGELPTGRPPVDLPVGKLTDVCEHEDRRAPNVGPRLVDAVSATTAADSSTLPSSPGRSAVGSIDGDGSKRRTRFPVSRRRHVPRTWANARRLLLHDLWNQVHRDADAGELHLVVAQQTHRDYPHGCPVALDWDCWIFKWFEIEWRDRRRIMRREITPALRSFVAGMATGDELPDEKPAREIEHQVDDVLERPPDPVVDVAPHELRELRSQFWVYRFLARRLADGTASLDALTDAQRHQLDRFVEVFGPFDP